MTSVRLQPAHDAEPLRAVASYDATDYALLVEPPHGAAAASRRISLDTLTLSFTPDRQLLAALDAYTNHERWERRPLAPPRVDRETALRCVEHFDEHGIGEGSPDPLRYTYSEESALLLIGRGGGGPAVSRVRCLSCVVCGLGADGGLLEIWVERLAFRR